MKVAIVSEWFYPDVGGVATHVAGLARALHSRGHKVVVFTATRNPDCLDGYKVVSVRRLVPLPHFPIVSLQVSFKGFDIVHVHHLFTPTPILSLLKASEEGVPCVVTNHTLPPLPRLTSKALTPFKRVFSKAATIVAVSRVSASFVSLIYDGPIHVVPNGVDTDTYTPADKPPEKPRVLFVGRLVYRKGVHVLIKAFEKVQREVREAELVVAGKGSMRPFLVGLAKRLRVNAKFVGFVKAEELPRLYRNSTVFVAPSLYAEAFGITVIEAMSSGLPVVASRCGGLREVVVDGETGILVDPGDPDSLAEALVQLLTDRDTLEKMGRKAREKAVKNYDWRVVVSKIENIYTEATSGYPMPTPPY